jgi:hypothetical protein
MTCDPQRFWVSRIAPLAVVADGGRNGAPYPGRRSESTPTPFSRSSVMTKVKSPSCVQRC